MANVNINRFYLTDIRVRISRSEISGSQRYYETRVDQVPPPSRPPAPAPVRACPPAPPPARACPPAPACPPARACPPAPAITKVAISEILRRNPYQKIGMAGLHVDVSLRLPSTMPYSTTSVINVGELQKSFPNVIERVTAGGGGKKKTKKVKKYKGGQSCELNSNSKINPSTYLFRPSTFNLDERNNSVYLPVYFDYYAYLTKNYSFLSLTPNTTNPLLSAAANNNIIMGIDALISCSFILDQNNIPYYITRIRESETENYYGIIKKCNPNAIYSSSGLDRTKYFKLDINYKSDLNLLTIDPPKGYSTFDFKDRVANELNYRSDLIQIQSIPDNINFPNITNPNGSLVKRITKPSTLLQPRMALGHELLPGIISPPPAPLPAPIPVGAPASGNPPASPPR